MINIYLNNIKSKVVCNPYEEEYFYECFGIRNPNAFFLRNYMPRGWDGKMRYYRDGSIDTGLIPDLVEKAKERKLPIKIKEVNFGAPGNELTIPETIGKYTIRGYQKEAVESIVNRKILGEPFHRGIIKAATNAGKNIIIAFTHKTFNEKSILIFNQKELFDTAVEELTDILGKDEIGFIKSGKVKWGNLMIIMAQTLSKNLHKYKSELQKFRVLFVDECDLADNKTYKKLLSQFHNTYVRVGLSGTYEASPLKKYLLRDTNIKGFFSGIVYTISNIELMDKGYSSKIIVKIFKGNTDPLKNLTFPEQEQEGIIRNKQRNKVIVNRVKVHVKNKSMPILVTSKYHKHIKILYQKISKAFPDLRVESVHHQTPDRTKIIARFKAGEIDILISSMIVRRGKNFPLMRAMINAGAGDSMANILQLLGRATRVHSSKEFTLFEDFFDEGTYLKRHSKHRIAALKKEQLEVLELYK